MRVSEETPCSNAVQLCFPRCAQAAVTAERSVPCVDAPLSCAVSCGLLLRDALGRLSLVCTTGCGVHVGNVFAVHWAIVPL